MKSLALRRERQHAVHGVLTAGGPTMVYQAIVELPSRRDVGALRLRLNAVKNIPSTELPSVASLMSGTKDPRIVLELDYWVLLARNA